MTSRPGLADRRRLAEWADARLSQSELPRLIRRLILETAPGVVELGIPADEGVAAGRWDGSVRSTKPNAWVPDGVSAWEMSVHGSPNTKANEDYEKRDTAPDGSSVSDCTYVEVILRPWTDRSDWASGRRAEGKWREVRAYGVDDIHTWMETAPVTWAWFSELVGLQPYGMRSGEIWWDTWARQTEPSIPPSLLVAGRQSCVEAVKGRMGLPGITTIDGPSLDETCAFIAAVAVDEAGAGQLLARLAVVNELSTWRSLLDSKQPLILVPLDPEFAREVPRESPHTVLVPVTDTAVADVVLPSLDAGGVTAALMAVGMSDEKAGAAGRLARQSLTALRRNLATNMALHRPLWAVPPVPRHVRAAMLAGAWSDQREGDQSILAELSGEAYEAFGEHAAALADHADPFILRVGPHWHLVAPVDAWLLLAERVTEDDVRRLEAAVRVVIGEIDPALDLPPDARWWKASLVGKVRSYSAELRRGLARCLALLGVHGSVIAMSGGISGEVWANHVVRDVLHAANQDPTGDAWASLSELLPLLAEAGPDAFIDAVTTGLTGDDPVLAKLFTDRDNDPIFGASSPHTGLLWALETVAWSPEHFGAAVDLLARLHAVDPGGRLSNRPLASIEAIFCPWSPENSASPERRLKVADGLRKRHNVVAWKLLISMLPEFHGTHFPTHGPDYRDWKPPASPVTNVEYFSFISAVVERCIDEAGGDGDRWKSLIDRYSDLPPNDRDKVVDALESVVQAERLAEADRDVVWGALREVVSRHREYPDAKWALPEDALAGLDALSTALQPGDAMSQNEWLFQDHMPRVGEVTRRDDFEAYDALVARRRAEAIRDIERDGGLDAVRALASRVEVVWSVGQALADSCSSYDDEMLGSLASDDHREMQMAGQYFVGRFRQDGWVWLEDFLRRHEGAAPLQRARLLLAPREFPRAWEVLEHQPSEVTNEYWTNFSPYGLGEDFAHVEFVAHQLMKVGRNAMAVDFLHMYLRRDGVDELRLARLIAMALDGLLRSSGDPEAGRLSADDFETSFELLEKHRDALGADVVARMEWGFLSALGYDPDVPALSEGLAANPEFFVEVVCEVYRPRGRDSTEEEPADELRAARARNGYRLLSSWNHPPGLVDGSIDRNQLRAWLDEATRLLRERDRLEVGLGHVGHVLASAPPDPDGGWPPEAVRDLLEGHSEAVENGLVIEILNRRGVTTRGLEDGGAQEDELAKRFRADADRFADEWPRIAALLRRVAASYEADARRNEDSSERFRRGLR
jgi:hypothetical protein